MDCYMVVSAWKTHGFTPIYGVAPLDSFNRGTVCRVASQRTPMDLFSRAVRFCHSSEPFKIQERPSPFTHFMLKQDVAPRVLPGQQETLCLEVEIRVAVKINRMDSLTLVAFFWKVTPSTKLRTLTMFGPKIFPIPIRIAKEIRH